MSLRDQLLKSGFADKRQVRKVNRELKRQRRQEQATRQSKAEIAAREAAEARRRRQEERARRMAEERERERLRELAEAKQRVEQILAHHRLRLNGGPQPFYHRAADGRHIHKLQLPERVAWELRAGKLGVAWRGLRDDAEYVVIPADVARRVARIDPNRVLFLNDEPPDDDDPAEALLEVS